MTQLSSLEDQTLQSVEFHQPQHPQHP
jgi:hypothetical protein